MNPKIENPDNKPTAPTWVVDEANGLSELETRLKLWVCYRGPPPGWRFIAQRADMIRLSPPCSCNQVHCTL